jgi:hypothetical protein
MMVGHTAVVVDAHTVVVVADCMVVVAAHTVVVTARTVADLAHLLVGHGMVGLPSKKAGLTKKNKHIKCA